MAELAWRGIWSKIMASLAVVLLIALSFGGNADNIGKEFTEKGLNRSLITFASALGFVASWIKLIGPGYTTSLFIMLWLGIIAMFCGIGWARLELVD